MLPLIAPQGRTSLRTRVFYVPIQLLKIHGLLTLPLLLAPPLSAAAPRTLKEVVAFVLNHGKDKIIDQHTSEHLGLTPIKTPAKAIWYKTKDDIGHRFNVVYIKDARVLKPKTLLWQVEKSTITANGKFLDGTGFQVSLAGQLQNAMNVVGVVGELKQTSLSINSPEVKQKFRQEMDFWLNQMSLSEWKP